MTWEFFKVLLPSAFTHFALTIAIFSVVYLFIRRSITLNYAVIFAFATALSLWFSMGTMVQISQNQSLALKQQELNIKAEQEQLAALPGNNMNLQPGSESEIIVRKQFLDFFEQMVATPQKVNEITRQKFLNSFQGIFKNAQLLQIYKSNVTNFYICNRAFFGDAIASLEKRKTIQSEDNKTCATLAGDFFKSKTLVPEAIITLYNDIVTKVTSKRTAASHKELPTIEELKQSFQYQNIALQIAALVFPQDEAK